MAFGKRRGNRAEDEAQWVSTADLMAGLMIVFLLFAIVLMRQSNLDKERFKGVIVAWEETQKDILRALEEEFRDDLAGWDAEIDADTLTFRFLKPDILFESGKDVIRPRFAAILDDFVPRYLKELSRFQRCSTDEGAPRGCIEEVRIEGHTSSEWGNEPPEVAYELNMALSQERARAVLSHVLEISDYEEHPWVRSRIAAVGFSSSRPVKASSGTAGTNRNRRVDFRVETTVRDQLMALIQARNTPSAGVQSR